MAKRSKLTDFTTGGNKPRPSATAKAEKPAAVKLAKPQKLADNAETPDRIVSTTIRLPEDAWKQVKRAAFDLGIPTNRIYTMALDDWCEAQGLPRLATK